VSGEGADCGGDHQGTCRGVVLGCPDCGKFSRHSWTTRGMYTPDGYYQAWGGICVTHGHWSDLT
jgi:hypothetical protein